MSVVFVTGASGQDGTLLIRNLLDEGHDVHALVRESAPDAADLISVHRGDIRDAALIGRLLRELRPDEVYHLAGQTSVAASWDDPVGTLETTALPAAPLLEAAAEVGSRFVLAASAEIFGNAAAPQDEQTPIRPLSPYGAAKALAHHLVGVYRARGVHASSCILFNHESPLRPDRFVTRKITRGAARIALGLDDRLVLGNFDARRDWGWAPDYVRALQLAVRHPEPADWVIGTGETHTVREFADAAFAAAGLGSAAEYLVADDAFVRPADPAELRADASKARAELGWAPTVGFSELVERMVLADLEQQSR
ncbi:GDP-mannose 4,6-dehydratase [Cryobacterium sp. BB736]|uniref:GDP-mannose 4,6-dehydratase n=1 Tax=Cryobacterium sp. BB736 TaxID=2746963 RepID=UPI001875264B|nr:GDP-mannose 4,6-dehydratase [Cryobacterium sp. BB736]